MDIRVAAYALIIEDGKILLAHWNEHGRSGWTLPGGGMEAGEHPEQTLEREVTEETGFTAIAQELIGIDSVVIPAARRVTPGAESPLQALRIIYTAQITGGELTYERDGSTDYAAWHDLAAVPGLRPLNLVLTGLELLENHRSPVAAGDNNGSTASDRRGGAGDEASAHAPAV